jgi:hypothetical protein
MPVTINGNGSIAGLSVGGLGAGVVNTATLADGAATQAKRTYAAGEIVQVATTTTVITQSLGQNPWDDVLRISSFTPKFANSILVFRASVRVQEGSGGVTNSDFRIRIHQDLPSARIAADSSGGNYAQYYVNVGNTINFFNATFSETNVGGTASRTYNFQMYEETGGSLYVGANNYGSCFTVEEIKV